MSDKQIVTTVPGPIVLTNGSFRCTDREDMLRRCRASIVVGLSPFKLTGLSGCSTGDRRHFAPEYGWRQGR